MKLDHGKENVGVTVPRKNFVDTLAVLYFINKIGNFISIIQQKKNGDVGIIPFDFSTDYQG
jgi:hypothetical protein